jgi:hypothetical protein
VRAGAASGKIDAAEHSGGQQGQTECGEDDLETRRTEREDGHTNRPHRLPPRQGYHGGVNPHRAGGTQGLLEQGVLKLKRRKGGYYWISLDGSRISGTKLFDVEELQPKFRDATEPGGR